MKRKWQSYVAANSYRKVYASARARNRATNRSAKAAAQTYGYGRFGVALHGAMMRAEDDTIAIINEAIWGVPAGVDGFLQGRIIRGLSSIIGHEPGVLIMDDLQIESGVGLCLLMENDLVPNNRYDPAAFVRQGNWHKRDIIGDILAADTEQAGKEWEFFDEDGNELKVIPNGGTNEEA